MRAAVIAALAALIVLSAAAATVPPRDVFNAPPFCPPVEAGQPEKPTSGFLDDIPEFNSSEIRDRLLRQWDLACKHECHFDKIFTHHREHYKTLDRVVVMDMSGVGGLNGLGNTLGYYIPFLKHSILLERAAFLRRNLPECEPRCSFDPGDYFMGRGGIDFRWSNATACAVARAMAQRGEKEHVLSLVYNQSSFESMGALDETTGEYIEGEFDFYSLLSHPSVAPLPWVRFLLPPYPRRIGGPGEAGWSMERTMVSQRHQVPTDLRDAAPELYRAVCLAPDQRQQLRNLSDGPLADVGRCGVHAFLYPAPRLQRLLAPLLPALDDTRRRCGALVGVHLRSGFADMGESLNRLLRMAPPPAADGAPRETAAEAVRNAWAVLLNATRPCPQRCHVGKPPDKLKGYLDDFDTPGCNPDGMGDAGDVCMDWPNNQLALWAAREAQANHDAHIAARAAGAGGGGGGGDGGGEWQQSSPLRFDIGEEEIGREVGLAPAMLTFAAWKAQELASDPPSIHSQRPVCPFLEPGALPWRLAVAGDLPLFVATAHASPSLQGRVIDAGRGAGAIGHVAMLGVRLGDEGEEGRRWRAACEAEARAAAASASAGGDAAASSGREGCSAEAGSGGAAAAESAAAAAHRKQLGAWSRSVLDLYLLSLCDYVVAAGSSSFTEAAMLMQIPGFGWVEKGDFFFYNRLRMTGKFVEQREGEVGWGLPLYLSMADAVQRLEAAGVGGSGVV